MSESDMEPFRFPARFPFGPFNEPSTESDSMPAVQPFSSSRLMRDLAVATSEDPLTSVKIGMEWTDAAGHFLWRDCEKDIRENASMPEVVRAVNGVSQELGQNIPQAECQSIRILFSAAWKNTAGHVYGMGSGGALLEHPSRDAITHAVEKATRNLQRLAFAGPKTRQLEFEL